MENELWVDEVLCSLAVGTEYWVWVMGTVCFKSLGIFDSRNLSNISGNVRRECYILMFGSDFRKILLEMFLIQYSHKIFPWEKMYILHSHNMEIVHAIFLILLFILKALGSLNADACFLFLGGATGPITHFDTNMD